MAWARTEEELREAQHLRYRVFADEMGARLTGPAGLDVDAFDHYCDHLLVRDLDTLKVVGTYRALPPHQAARIGRLYAESEFDVSRLTHLRPKMVEVGRSCVHPDYRSGAVIMSLWGGLASYMLHNGYETMLGCASVAMADGGHYAANLYCALRDSAMTAQEYRAFPHTPLPVDELQTGADGRTAAARQRLSAARRENLWRTGLGSRLQYGRLSDAAASVRNQRAICTPLPWRCIAGLSQTLRV